MFIEIEKRLGLHQELRIIYTVDGFMAMLYKYDDCSELIAEDKGISIDDALDNLNTTLEKIS